jgi:hypothetical protein
MSSLHVQETLEIQTTLEYLNVASSDVTWPSCKAANVMFTQMHDICAQTLSLRKKIACCEKKKHAHVRMFRSNEWKPQDL